MDDIEDSVERAAAVASSKVRRPWLCFLLLTFGLVICSTGSGPLLALFLRRMPVQVVRIQATSSASWLLPPLLPSSSPPLPKSRLNLSPPPPPPPPPSPLQVVLAAAVPTCGNGRCEPPETVDTCFADCPGVTTPATCGEEPHMDPQGHAVIDGRGHKKASAAECCEACAGKSMARK